jgi:hypothetical protein
MPCLSQFSWLITWITFGEEYRVYRFALYSISHFTITSQHPVLENPHPTFLRQCERPSFTTIQNNKENYSSVSIRYFVVQINSHC